MHKRSQADRTATAATEMKSYTNPLYDNTPGNRSDPAYADLPASTRGGASANLTYSTVEADNSSMALSNPNYGAEADRWSSDPMYEELGDRIDLFDRGSFKNPGYTQVDQATSGYQDVPAACHYNGDGHSRVGANQNPGYEDIPTSDTAYDFAAGTRSGVNQNPGYQDIPASDAAYDFADRTRSGAKPNPGYLELPASNDVLYDVAGADPNDGYLAIGVEKRNGQYLDVAPQAPPTASVQYTEVFPTDLDANSSDDEHNSDLDTAI